MLKPVFLGQVSTAKWKTPPSYVAGDKINVTVLERSVKDKEESPLVSSRTLFTNARNCLANVREMLSVVAYWTKDGQPKKSGENWDIVLERVLDHMWKRNQGKEAAKNTKLIPVEDLQASYKSAQEQEKNGEKKGATNDLKERPNGWIPQGWMAFLLFGPTPYKSKALPLTQVGDLQAKEKDAKKKQGRQSARDNTMKEKAIIRNNDSENERGMTRSQQLVAVGLQQKMLFMEAMDKQTKILSNQKSLSFLENKVERLSKIAMHLNTAAAWKSYEEAERELQQAVAKAKDSPVKNEESKNAIASYLKNVLPINQNTPAKRKLEDEPLRQSVTDDTDSPKDSHKSPGTTSKTVYSSQSNIVVEVPTQLASATPPSDLDASVTSYLRQPRPSDFPLGQPSQPSPPE